MATLTWITYKKRVHIVPKGLARLFFLIFLRGRGKRDDLIALHKKSLVPTAFSISEEREKRLNFCKFIPREPLSFCPTKLQNQLPLKKPVFNGRKLALFKHFFDAQKCQKNWSLFRLYFVMPAGRIWRLHFLASFFASKKLPISFSGLRNSSFWQKTEQVFASILTGGAGYFSSCCKN